MAGTASSVLNRLIQHATRPRPPPKPSRRSGPPTSSLLAHLDSGDLYRAIAVLASSADPFPPSTYSRILRLCAARRALPETRRVESHIVASSPNPRTFLLNRVIEAYAACGSLADARELFDEMPRRDGGTWNAIISASARCNSPHSVLRLFSLMNNDSPYHPNEITFASVLGSCANVLALPLARQSHALLEKYGFSSNVILATSLVDVYGKCQLIDDARSMFDSIRDPNPVSWNVIVRRYLEAGRAEESVLMFFNMIRRDVKPMGFTVSNALVACSDVSALWEGRRIHGVVSKVSFRGNNIVENSLLDMYAKCGVIEDARRLFDGLAVKDVFSWTSIVSGYASSGRIGEAESLFEEMPTRNVVSWNALLAGYVRFAFWNEAVDLVYRMRREVKDIDHVSLGLILNASAGMSDLELGKQAHAFALRRGCCSDLFFGNALLEMYVKCGSLRSAEILFVRMASSGRDRISWNSILSGYARHGRSDETLTVFREMQCEVVPNESTFSVLLAACANIFMLEHGMQIHGYMIRNGYEIDVINRGALVDMYSKCRSIEYAIRVFKVESSRDIILWNSIILGCAYNGRGEYGLELFEAMKKDGVRADNVSFVGALLACIGEGYVDLGRRYFDSMSRECSVIPRIEHYECMIELLGKHGCMTELEDFIERMPFEPTIPMWTRIFDCCREYGDSKLGERAAKYINESDPLNPVRFEVLSSAISGSSK